MEIKLCACGRHYVVLADRPSFRALYRDQFGWDPPDRFFETVGFVTVVRVEQRALEGSEAITTAGRIKVRVLPTAVAA